MENTFKCKKQSYKVINIKIPVNISHKILQNSVKIYYIACLIPDTMLSKEFKNYVPEI